MNLLNKDTGILSEMRKKQITNDSILFGVPLLFLSMLVGISISQGYMLFAVFLIGAILLLLLFQLGVNRLINIWLLLSCGMQWWSGIELGNKIPNITFDRFLLILALCMVFLSGKKFIIRGFSKVVIINYLIFCVYSLILVLFRATNYYAEIFFWFSWVVMPIIAMILGISIDKGEKWWNKVLIGSKIISFYFFIPAVIEFVTKQPFFSSSYLSGIPGIEGGVRVASLAGNSVTLSYSLALLFPFIIFPFGIERTFRQRLMDWFFLIITLLTILMSGYRTEWVASILTILLSIIFLLKTKKSIIWLAFIVVVILVLMSSQITSSEYMTNRVLDKTNIMFRFEAIYSQLSRASDNYVFGIGGSESWNVVSSSNPSRTSILYASHNTYMTLLLYQGVIGLFLYLFGFIISFWNFKSFFRLLELQYFKRLFLIILVFIAGLITAFGHDIRFFTTNNCILFFWLGVFVQEFDNIKCSGMQKNQ